MNKLNNNGMTLVELIISFMIVAIASIYLYQTLIVVSKLYRTARDETNNYVDVNYAYRIIDRLIDELDEEEYNKFLNDPTYMYMDDAEYIIEMKARINAYSAKDSYFKVENFYDRYTSGTTNIIIYNMFIIDGKKYFLYKYQD